MYRPRTSKSERVGTFGVVLLLHGVLGAALVTIGGVDVLTQPDEPLETFDISLPPPEPEPVVEIEEPSPEVPREEGEAAPEQVESQATEVVVPEPLSPPIPVPPTVIAAPRAGEGDDPTQGAGEVDDGGTGAGGQGDGTGAGQSGDGLGGGGGTRPSVVPSTTLTQRDYPRELRRAWPRGGAVLVAVRVQVDGRATDCKINRSIGNAAIDAETCRLVEQKVRFNPARNARGEPYVAWYGYMQRWVGG